MKRLLRGLTENRVRTDPAAPDGRIRGRTYAIPFEDVWRAAWQLAGGGIWGWSLIRADDQHGVIEAVCKTLVFRLEDDIRIEVTLDENAQTRVDLWSASRMGRGDLGRNRRTVGKFLRRLDRKLAASPALILDPTKAPGWLEPR